ncbi:MAG TPA: GNAT family N-acetyltransferase [Acidimicrobiales bacterium]
MLTVRTATLEDLPAVIVLWRAEAGPTRHAGQLAEATVLVERDREALVVAESDGTLVGALVAGWDGWRFHLYRLAVASAQRRTGVASALLDAAVERARTLGAVRVDAMVNARNADAEHFWRNAGFECDGTDRRWSIVL